MGSGSWLQSTVNHCLPAEGRWYPLRRSGGDIWKFSRWAVNEDRSKLWEECQVGGQMTSNASRGHDFRKAAPMPPMYQTRVNIGQSANISGTCINLLMAVLPVCSPYFFDHQHFSHPQAMTVLSLFKSFTSVPTGGHFSSLSSSQCWLPVCATALSPPCFYLWLAVIISASSTTLSSPPGQDLCFNHSSLFQWNLTACLA